MDQQGIYGGPVEPSKRAGEAQRPVPTSAERSAVFPRSRVRQIPGVLSVPGQTQVDGRGEEHLDPSVGRFDANGVKRCAKWRLGQELFFLEVFGVVLMLGCSLCGHQLASPLFWGPLLGCRSSRHRMTICHFMILHDTENVTRHCSAVYSGPQQKPVAAHRVEALRIRPTIRGPVGCGRRCIFHHVVRRFVAS